MEAPVLRYHSFSISDPVAIASSYTTADASHRRKLCKRKKPDVIVPLPEDDEVVITKWARVKDWSNKISHHAEQGKSNPRPAFQDLLQVTDLVCKLSNELHWLLENTVIDGKRDNQAIREESCTVADETPAPYLSASKHNATHSALALHSHAWKRPPYRTPTGTPNVQIPAVANVDNLGRYSMNPLATAYAFALSPQPAMVVGFHHIATVDTSLPAFCPSASDDEESEDGIFLPPPCALSWRVNTATTLVAINTHNDGAATLHNAGLSHAAYNTAACASTSATSITADVASKYPPAGILTTFCNTLEGSDNDCDSDSSSSPEASSPLLDEEDTSPIGSTSSSPVHSPEPPTAHTMVPSKAKHKRRKALNHRICERCGTKNTSTWRRGPSGPQTLCNACGLKYARLKKQAN